MLGASRRWGHRACAECIGDRIASYLMQKQCMTGLGSEHLLRSLPISWRPSSKRQKPLQHISLPYPTACAGAIGGQPPGPSQH